ncbi:probable WRKY transcription factor 43 [Punica granatum]|uniref:WRKY domain-containing protein n=2 Tax=Punica granatum TaxID=22663 RepID=A0A218VW16_PUNGR|nr:probable WRKY transcription factor 43 [Punica granatum]OWM64280.1 hypothetical protein CDL15_Pgr018852 [Punica granatum]PKI46355.1 hypothetical protein CRG98_033250 [Punica granatum]
MEGREPPQDLPDHLFVSSSDHPAPSEPSSSQLPRDLDWVSSFLQLPPYHGGSNDATGAGSSSLVGGGAPVNADEEERNVGGKERRKAGGGHRTRKATRPRFAFRTRSSEDILDDGYRWRKYGQKAVKNSIYPRSYYRCAHHTCNVKKQVQRLSEDTSTVVTTYEGVHNHPCEQLMEALAPLLRQIQFLSKF